MAEAGLEAAMVAALEDPALWVGASRRIEAANVGAREVLGALPAGALVRSVIRQPEPVAALERGFEALAEGGGGPFVAQMLKLGAISDETLTMRVMAVAPGQGQGQPGGLLVTFRDLGQIAAAEQQRRDFVANVSHELRSPLTVLTGFIDTLRGPARDDPQAQARFLDIMEREAQRMNRLVDDLLSLSRVESEERVRPRAQVDLSEVLHATLAALRPVIEASGVTVTTEGIDAPILLPGARDQLVQVFRNLLENALKYGASGGRVEIRVARRENAPGFAGPVVEASVIDFGEGIDAIHLPRLTERFYRVDAHRSREQGGTGLGLAIVKHIVHRHRGRLSAQSVRGEGSRFTALLPLS